MPCCRRVFNPMLYLTINSECLWYKSGLFLGVISLHYRAFSYGQGTELEYFWGLLIFKHFWAYA